jgi:ATP-dependent helicase/nuclease subunit A
MPPFPLPGELHPIVQQMSPSAEQIPAVMARGCNVVVTAGAGSGKTRTLVARYLALLSEGVPLRSIIAITFTKKAAREMRNRVRDEMRRYLDRSDLTEDEEEHWRRLYTQLDAARIGTIHGLCSSILRAHAAEAGVDPRFTVMDETPTTIMRLEALEEAMAWASQESAEAPLFALLGERMLRQTLQSLLERRLDAVPCLAGLPQPLWPHWEDLVLAPLSRFVDNDEVRASFEQLLALRSNGALAHAGAAGDKLAPPLVTLLQLWDQIADLRPQEDWDGISVLLAPLRENMKQSGAAKNWPAGSPKPTIAELQRLYDRDLKPLVGKGADLSLDRRLADAQPALKLLLDHTLDLYERRKNERQALDNDDLEQGALDLLRRHPEVRRRWQEEVSALLVDEFQDTNQRQRDLVALLSGEDGGSQGSGVSGTRSGLFIVGDAKQSIYRFRGADVSVFRQERRDIAADGGLECTLDVSYRAHRGLIGALNALLRPVLGDQPDPARPWLEPFAALEPCRQQPSAGFAAPHVELHLALGAKSGGGLDRAADALARRLDELVAGGRCFVAAAGGGSRPLRYDDIAILCRASNSFAAYEDALERAGVPFLTVAGKGFYQRREVRELLNALEALADPGYDLALAGLLRSPAFALTDEALYRLCQARDERGPVASLWDALRSPPAALLAADLPRAQRAAGIIEELHQQVGRTSVADLLTGYVSATASRAALLATAQTRAARNVSKLLADAYESGIVSVGEFLDYLRNSRQSGAREGEARATAEGAVQIMSVHQAKGMEFSVVVIGDATQESPGRARPILHASFGVLPPLKDEARALPLAYRMAKVEEDDKEAAESDRLLYVAATRAQEKLILNGCARPNAAGGFGALTGWLGRLTSTGGLALQSPAWPASQLPGAPLTTELQAAGEPVSCTYYPEEYDTGLAQPSQSSNRESPTTMPPPLLAAPSAHGEAMDEKTEQAQRTPPRRVWQVAPLAEKPTAPAWVVGSLVHQALAAWRFPDAGFEEWVTAQARGHGLTDARQLRDAHQRTSRLLNRFREHPLFQEMAAASRRLHEVPYSISVGDVVENGIIDALFNSSDSSGDHEGDSWTLVEFKTDEVRDEAGLAALYKRTDYLIQTRRYVAAASALLGRRPAVIICLLDFAGEVRVERAPLAE